MVSAMDERSAVGMVECSVVGRVQTLAAWLVYGSAVTLSVPRAVMRVYHSARGSVEMLAWLWVYIWVSLLADQWVSSMA